MATQTTILYNATDTLGKGLTKSLTNANPDAGASVLEGFASGLNSLTTNTYGGAVRIDKTNLDEGATSTKTTPTLTFGEATINRAAIAAASASAPFGLLVDINYSGDGVLSVDNVYTPDEVNDHHYSHAAVVYVDGAPKLKIIAHGWLASWDDGARDTTVTVRASETDTCNAVSATFTYSN